MTTHKMSLIIACSKNKKTVNTDNDIVILTFFGSFAFTINKTNKMPIIVPAVIPTLLVVDYSLISLIL